MKLREIVKAQRRLDKATVTKLDEGDAIKLLKARKAMRPFVCDYESFEKDCHEKLKFDGLEEAEKVRQEVVFKHNEDSSYKPSQDEIDAINKVVEYVNKVERALKDELEKDVELALDKLSENADVKIQQENGWTYAELDEIGILL